MMNLDFMSQRNARKSADLGRILVKEELKARHKQVTEILKKNVSERSADEQSILVQSSDIAESIQKRSKHRETAKKRRLEVEDPEHELEAKCRQLVDALRSSRCTVLYTGAGISTAASIPDYRGPNGVWTLLQQGKEPSAQDLSDAEPTFTHMAITELYRKGLISHVVSQNCDGLHLRSGMPRSALSEVHGDMYIEICTKCKPQRDYVRLFDTTEDTGVRRHLTSRHCNTCDHKLRDTIVHFGEKSVTFGSPYNWESATEVVDGCDLILCLGSSLKVLRKYPCLWSLHKTAAKRPQLFIVNLQWTPKDDLSTLKLNGKCDGVLKTVMQNLNIQVPEYRRECDPIFSLAISLLPQDVKTVSKKILEIPDNLEPYIEVKTTFKEHDSSSKTHKRKGNDTGTDTKNKKKCSIKTKPGDSKLMAAANEMQKKEILLQDHKLPYCRHPFLQNMVESLFKTSNEIVYPPEQNWGNLVSHVQSGSDMFKYDNRRNSLPKLHSEKVELAQDPIEDNNQLFNSHVDHSYHAHHTHLGITPRHHVGTYQFPTHFMTPFQNTPQVSQFMRQPVPSSQCISQTARPSSTNKNNNYSSHGAFENLRTMLSVPTSAQAVTPTNGIDPSLLRQPFMHPMFLQHHPYPVHPYPIGNPFMNMAYIARSFVPFTLDKKISTLSNLTSGNNTAENGHAQFNFQEQKDPCIDTQTNVAHNQITTESLHANTESTHRQTWNIKVEVGEQQRSKDEVLPVVPKLPQVGRPVSIDKCVDDDVRLDNLPREVDTSMIKVESNHTDTINTENVVGPVTKNPSTDATQDSAVSNQVQKTAKFKEKNKTNDDNPKTDSNKLSSRNMVNLTNATDGKNNKDEINSSSAGVNNIPNNKKDRETTVDDLKQDVSNTVLCKTGDNDSTIMVLNDKSSNEEVSTSLKQVKPASKPGWFGKGLTIRKYKKKRL